MGARGGLSSRGILRDPATRRRAGAAALLAFVALSGVQCVQDLIGPSAKHHVYTFESVGPVRFNANIGDTLTPPTARLTVDGAAATVGIGVTVLQGAGVARVDSAGRLIVLGAGEAVLRLRPLSAALAVDTLHVDDTLHAVVPVLAVTGPDTVFSLQDTVRLVAHPRTRGGVAIGGAPTVWRLTSGAGVVTLLDSTTGSVRSETNGDAVLTGVSDTATVQRPLRVRQKAVSVVPAGAILFHWAGHSRQLAPQVKDGRAQLVAAAALTHVSRNPAVATVNGAGVVTAVGDGTTRIVTSASGPGGGSASDSTTVVVQSARLAILAGNNQVASVGATLPLPLAVKLVDVAGAAVADSLARVVFRVTAGSGRFGAADSLVVLTDTLGRASASLTLGTAMAPTTVQVSGTGLAGGAVTFTATPAPVARLRFAVQPSAVPAGGSIAPVVKAEVRDTFGTVVPSVPESVTVSLAAGTGTAGAALLGTTKVVTSAGVATFPSLTVDKAGNGYRLVVTASGLAPDTSAAFNVTAGAPDHMAFLAQPLGARAGVPVYPAVQVKVVDASGNVIPTFTGDVTLSVGRVPATGSDRYFGTATVAAVAGVAAFSDFGIQTAAAGYKLRAASSGLVAILSDLFDVSGAPDTLRLVSGNGQGGIVNAVLADSLVVRVVDAAGIGVAGDSVVFKVTAGGATIGGADSAVVLTVAGRAAVALRLGAATGTDSVVVRSKSLAGRTVTFAATAVEAGNHLQFVTQPTSFALGAQVDPPVQVRVRNGFGQTVTGATATITLAVLSGTGRAGATVAGTSSAPAVAGVATFLSQGVSRSGTGYRLVATATDIASDTSAAFDVLQRPTSLVKEWGDNQNGNVGARLSDDFVVRVLDAAGDPIPGEIVVFRVVSGAGTLYAGTDSMVAATDAAGRALAGLALGPSAGTVTVSAHSQRYVDLRVTFTASATEAGRRLQFVTQPTSIVAGTTFSPAVQVRVFDGATGLTDTSATTIIHLWNSSGLSLTGAVEPDGTRFAQAVHGVATFDGLGVTGPVGTGFRLRASADKLGTDSTTPFDVTVGAPARLGIEFAHGTVKAGDHFMEYVRILDANGNVVTTATNPVTIALGGGRAGAHLRGTLTADPVDGVARFLGLSVDSVGNGYTLSASATGLAGVTGPAFDVSASRPHHPAFGVSPTGATAGAVMNEVRVLVLDSLGNLSDQVGMAAGLSLGANPGGGSLLGTTYVPVIDGIASFTDLRLRFPGTGYTLVAALPSLPEVTSAPFDILTGAAAKLAFNVQPTTVLLSQAITPAVRVEVQDTVGNLVTTSAAPVALAITSGTGGIGASLAGTTTRNATGGAATFADLSIATLGGDYTLTATSGGLASAVSNAFDVLSTTSDRLVVTSVPAGAVAGAPFEVTVEVRNAAGTRIATATNPVTLSLTPGAGPAGAHLRGPLTVAASAGLATFHVSVDSTGGGYVLAARSPGLFSGASAALAILPAGRHHVAFRVQPTSRTAGNLFAPPIQVAVYDSLGNLQADETDVVTLSITPGSGASDATLSGAHFAPVGGGVATFADLSIAKAGTGYSLTASYSAPALTAVSNTFSIVPGPAASVVFSPQEPATLVGAGSTRQLAATVLDAHGNALTGATILWGSHNPGVATVNAEGLVTAVGPGQATLAVDSGAASGFAVVTVSVPELPPVNLWVPMASGTTLPLSAVWGSSRINAYAVGSDPVDCANHVELRLGENLTWTPIVTGAATCLTGVGSLSVWNVYATGSHGQLRAYDGSNWQNVTTGTTDHLSTLWAASPASIFAVGENGTIGRFSIRGAPPVLLPSGVTGWLWAVFGTSESNVFAGGQDGKLLHFDGSAWTTMASPSTQSVNGLWGTSTNSIYAATGQGVLHWNGSTWAPMGGVESVSAGSVWGSSDNDVYVPSGGSVWRYDGNQWTQTLLRTPALGSVWGTPDGAVFLAGSGGTILRGVRNANVSVTPEAPTLTALGATMQLGAAAREPGGASVGGIRFTWTSGTPDVATVDSNGVVTAVANGTAEIRATAPGGAYGSVALTVRQEPQSIQIDGSGEIYETRTAQLTATLRDARGNLITGYPVTWRSSNPAIVTIDIATGLATGVTAGKTAIAVIAGDRVEYRPVTVYDAGGEPEVNLWAPMSSPTISDLAAVWGASENDVWAAGVNGTFLHFDGASWESRSVGVAEDVRGLSGVADTAIWAGLSTGTIVHWNGHTWAHEASGIASDVRAVTALTPRDVYAVGLGGKALHFDGTTWSDLPSGTTADLFGVYYGCCGQVFAVGAAGTALASWIPQSTGSTAILRGIWGQKTDNSESYFVGSGGTILRGEPAGWTSMTSGTTRDLWAVWGTATFGRVYAVGDSGTVLHWNGVTWSPMRTGTTASLRAIWGTGTGSVYVVGQSGTILRGLRGATVGVAPASPTLTALGAQLQLGAIAREPGGAPIAGVPLTWSSSDSAIATVDGTGLVTAVANGTATISATAPGGASGSTVVTVHQRAATVRFEPPGQTLNIEANPTFTMTVVAEDSLGHVMDASAAEFRSLNTEVAAAGGGVVTAVAAGQATIEATMPGGRRGYFLATVIVPGATAVNLWRRIPTGVTDYFRGVWGTSASGVYVSRDAGEMLHFDGTYWTAMPGQTSAQGGAVWGSSATDVFAVGGTGTAPSGAIVSHWNGSGWTQTNLGTTGALYGIWGASPNDVFAVGDGGAIYHFDGTTWTLTQGGWGRFRAVWGSSLRDVFAVGDGGLVVHYDGTTWTTMNSNTTGDLLGVWGAANGDVYAAGQSEAFIHYDGTNWSQMPFTATPGFRALWGTANNDLYGAVNDGLARFDGTPWRANGDATTAGVLAIWGTSAHEVFAVGTMGTILQGFRGATIQLTPANPSIVGIGNSQQLTAIARDASVSEVSGVTFTWTSDNLSAATVDATGKVTAVGAGTATITVTTSGGASASTTVTVSP